MTLPVTEGAPRVTLRPNEKCPTCKRPFAYLREGTYLPPTKVRLFDLIRERPGVMVSDVAEALYERNDEEARASVRVHISQLRKFLAGSSTRIMSARASGYWLEEGEIDVGT